MSAASTVLATEGGEGFTPPGPADFDLPPIFGGGSDATLAGMEVWGGVTKPMVQLVLAAVVVFLFFRAASAKREMVPGRLQFVGETAYGFVRNTLARDVIGAKDFARFVPLLSAMFFFILLNNLMASIPLLQFPTLSRAGFVYALAAIAWVTYNGVGIQRHGFLGYLKLQTMPAGVPAAMYVILIPLEFFSNILVRPFTLALRLFANMFAGHLLLILFALGGEYLLFEAGAALAPVGVLTWLLFIAIAFLELLVQFLQAFIFTILTSLYISSAVADEH